MAERDGPPPTSGPHAALRDALVLGRCRLVQLGHLLDQQLRETPVRTFVVLLLLGIIWAALYFLLQNVFYQVGRWELVAVVASRPIFTHFFLVLAVMLAISNAVLAFGSLFGREEAAHLLALPARPRQVLLVKWVEGMVLSSWSFLLLGVPLMLAVASTTTVPWYYYPLFVGHFLAFILLPATFGLLVAWAIAMWVPRRPLLVLVWLGAILLVAGGYYIWSLSQQAVETEEWLRLLFRDIGPVRHKLLPSTWTAGGIVAAMERRVGDSLVYLLVVLGNAAFFAWLVLNVLGATWAEAYSRARQGRGSGQVRVGWFTAALCWALFFYLPARLRRIMLKDLRSFARDAAQWTQMVIMLGLLVIYALNLKRLPLDLNRPELKTLIVFLNLVTISLILATFTSRFVYPLLSLESQQLWLLGLLPMRRTTLLLVKFLFALTVSGLSGVGVMALSVVTLELPPAWALLNTLLCFGICAGLSGLSVGIGARFPVMGQRNAARIASGFGGTLNLIASMVFVTLQMVGVAVLALRELRALDDVAPPLASLSAASWRFAGGLLLLSLATAAGALFVGGRHLERLEC